MSIKRIARRLIAQRTTSFTPEQETAVNTIVMELADHCAIRINAEATDIKDMDHRPKETYTPKNPDVFFPYVAKGMLENLIHELGSRV